VIKSLSDHCLLKKKKGVPKFAQLRQLFMTSSTAITEISTSTQQSLHGTDPRRHLARPHREHCIREPKPLAASFAITLHISLASSTRKSHADTSRISVPHHQGVYYNVTLKAPPMRNMTTA
jgi:hypothetical protein